MGVPSIFLLLDDAEDLVRTCRWPANSFLTRLTTEIHESNCIIVLLLPLQMEGMVRDLQMARERQQAFSEWCSTNSRKLDLALEVTVLTTGYWPTNKSIDLTLPAELVAGVELFKEFYELENKNRKLTWVYMQVG